MAFVAQLRAQLEAHRNQDDTLSMQAYMKDLFPFLGIKAPQRKALFKDVLNSYKDDVRTNCRDIAIELYQLDEREFHYCAIEIVDKFLHNKYVESDFEFITGLITSKPHWDTVDFIAKHILGNYILQFWDDRYVYIQQLSNANHMWLNRSAILFQLGYKAKTDTEILFKTCETHADSDEFFIQKAIGWALREFAKTDAQSVIDFTSKIDLKPLSVREALKRLK
ncbi:DNA alkylation repair protein [Winogradskyella sp.]|uniref:DNA alkylation repair protein n=1 Tax=Winogradskyella sp. TaxID=1883156 RepID=UPI0026316424|nr:DNA alkylation repair protein [Winogradskyella sp.]